MFEPLKGSNKAAYIINKVTLDIVYGSYLPTPAEADNDVTISRKSSVIFKGNIEARKNSGAPGYITGNLLKTGTLSTDKMTQMEAAKATPYIKEPVNGFQLLGANNKGECFKIKKTLTDGQVDISKKDGSGKFDPNKDMADSQDYKYFDAPTLTFEDSIVTGCHLDLNYDELETFCKEKQFQNLMIFQNLYNLKQIGKYGNSDPHFVDDWITVAQDTNVLMSE